MGELLSGRLERELLERGLTARQAKAAATAAAEVLKTGQPEWELGGPVDVVRRVVREIVERIKNPKLPPPDKLVPKRPPSGAVVLLVLLGIYVLMRRKD